MQECSIGDFGLPIGLRVANGHEMMGDSHFLIEVGESGFTELMAIVSDQNLGKTKSAYDGFLDEILYLGFYDFGQWFGHHPFHKVIDGYKEKFSLTCDL